MIPKSCRLFGQDHAQNQSTCRVGKGALFAPCPRGHCNGGHASLCPPLYGAFFVKRFLSALLLAWLLPFHCRLFLVSFFVRPQDRFFVPTCRGAVTPGAAAVKAGRRSVERANAGLGRPRLDGGEHGVTLGGSGPRRLLVAARGSAALRPSIRGEPAVRRHHRLTTLYSVNPRWRIRTMMQSCASAAGSSAAGPFYRSGTKARVGIGSPPPRIVWALDGIADRRRTLLCQSPSRAVAGIVAAAIVRPP
jgi:hypothetical protein